MIVIIGGGPTGENCARELSRKGEEPLCLVTDNAAAGRLEALGLSVKKVTFKGFVRTVPRDAGAVFVLAGDDRSSLGFVTDLRKARPDLLILSEAVAHSAAVKMRDAGADYVMETKKFVATAMLDQITGLEERRAARRLLAALRPCRKRGLAIFLHNDPDPDSLAAGLALKRICASIKIQCRLYHGGKVGHPENRAMVSFLGLELEPVGSTEKALEVMARHARTALVESSLPGQNNILPVQARPNIVIDHHPLPPGTTVAGDFIDIRPLTGAVSTIMTGYLRDLWIRPDPVLAAALIYGIKVDTNGFTRGTTRDDIEAAGYLSEHADLRLLRQFEAPPMPAVTAEVIAHTIADREVVHGHLLAFAGRIQDRDSLAEAAELLVRLEGVTAAVVFGILDDDVCVSARSPDTALNLGAILRRAFSRFGSAGGHASFAGARFHVGKLVRGSGDAGRAVRDAVFRAYLTAAGIRGGD